MRYSEVCELGVVTWRNLGMPVGEVRERLSRGYEFLPETEEAFIYQNNMLLGVLNLIARP
jgi:hypothetical protein